MFEVCLVFISTNDRNVDTASPDSVVNVFVSVFHTLSFLRFFSNRNKSFVSIANHSLEKRSSISKLISRPLKTFASRVTKSFLRRLSVLSAVKCLNVFDLYKYFIKVIKFDQVIPFDSLKIEDNKILELDFVPSRSSSYPYLVVTPKNWFCL